MTTDMTNTKELANEITKLNMKEISAEELSLIMGGEGEDNGAMEWLLDKALGAVCAVLKDLIGSCIPPTFEEFYKDYCAHKTAWDIAIGTAVAAVIGSYISISL